MTSIYGIACPSAMFTQAELEDKVAQYVAQGIDIDAFQNWFQTGAWGMYDRPGDAMSDVIDNVSSLLQDFEDGLVEESTFRQELVAAASA